MLAQPKLLSWSSAKTRIANQLYYTSKIHEDSPNRSSRSSSLSSTVAPISLFSSRVNQFFFLSSH